MEVGGVGKGNGLARPGRSASAAERWERPETLRIVNRARAVVYPGGLPRFARCTARKATPVIAISKKKRSRWTIMRTPKSESSPKTSGASSPAKSVCLESECRYTRALRMRQHYPTAFLINSTTEGAANRSTPAITVLIPRRTPRSSPKNRLYMANMRPRTNTRGPRTKMR